jgi:eukaryotic-like serine/threonine-protein kinase
MELLQGQSLGQLLRAEGKVHPGRAAEIACAVCEALAQAHTAGIVHRDIKPSNVFLHQSPTEQVVKVIDFGIAKLTDESQAPGADTTTQSGMFLGTPAYMAPERVFNLKYDGRADVYAVGVMIYEMVAGRLPFERSSGGHLSLMRMHAVDKPAPLTKVAPDAPVMLELAVERALAKDPTERPTAAELGEMLRDLIMGMRISSRARRSTDSYTA